MSENPSDIGQGGADVPPPGSSANQGFILAVSILGGIFLIALIVMAIYVIQILPRNRAQQSTTIAKQSQTLIATATVAIQATQVPTKTATPIPATATRANTATSAPTATVIKPTNTSVVAVATNTPGSSILAGNPQTATVAALLTQAQQAILTATALPTSTGLPKTGFAEGLGIPEEDQPHLFSTLFPTCWGWRYS